VTEGWLTYLVALANLAPDIALVGPMSNHAAPPQQVETVFYRLTSKQSPDGRGNRQVDVSGVHAFAREFRQQHRGRWLEVGHLGGFCLLLKRAVLGQLGPLPSSSGLDVFDTAASCQKARQAGPVRACCADQFIHHFGSRPSTVGPPR
jgi:hypothetical protein